MGKIADNRSVTWITSERTTTSGPVVTMPVHTRTEVTGQPAQLKVRKPRRQASDGER